MSRSYLSAVAFTAAAAIAAHASAGTVLDKDFSTVGDLATGLTSANSVKDAVGIGGGVGGYTGGIAAAGPTGVNFNFVNLNGGPAVTDTSPTGTSTTWFADYGAAAFSLSPVSLSADTVVVVEYGAYSNVGRNGEDFKTQISLVDSSASGVQFRSIWSNNTVTTSQNPNGIRQMIGNGKAGGESNSDTSIGFWDGNFNNTDITAGNDAVLGQVARSQHIVRFVGHDGGALGGTNLNVESRATNDLTGNGSTAWVDTAANNIGASTVTGSTAAARNQLGDFSLLSIAAYRTGSRSSTIFGTGVADFNSQRIGLTDVKVITTKTSDFNLDGATDGSDLNIWNTNKFTSGQVMGTGDATNDGAVDGSDLNVWNTNKFQSHDLIPPEVTDVADVVYDPSDGSLKLVVNSGSVQAALLVQTVSGNISSTTTANLPLFAGVVPAWTYTYFNGKMQYTDGTLGLGGTPIGPGEYMIASLLPNLDASAFGTVEYGSSAGTQFTGVSVIPEPASLALLAMGGMCLIRRRRAA